MNNEQVDQNNDKRLKPIINTIDNIQMVHISPERKREIEERMKTEKREIREKREREKRERDEKRYLDLLKRYEFFNYKLKFKERPLFYRTGPESLRHNLFLQVLLVFELELEFKRQKKNIDRLFEDYRSVNPNETHVTDDLIPSQQDAIGSSDGRGNIYTPSTSNRILLTRNTEPDISNKIPLSSINLNDRKTVPERVRLGQISLESRYANETLHKIGETINILEKSKTTTQILDQIEENVNLLENLFKLFLLNRLNLYKEFFFNNVVEKDVRNPQQYRESTEFIRNEERIMMSDNGSPMDKARAELFKECRIIPYSHEIHEVDTGIILESIHSGKQRNITNELQNFRRLFIKNNEFLRETPVQEFFNMFTDNLIQQWSEFHEKFEEEGYFKMYPVNRHLLYELDTLENDNKDVIRQVIRQIGTVRGSQEEVSTTTTNNKPPFHHKKAKNMKLTQEGRKKVVRQMQQFHNEL